MFKRKEVNERELVSDLDKILVEKVSFKLHGKIHTIAPLTAAQFFQYSNALNDLHASEKKMGAEELVNKYHALAHPIVPTIEKSDIAKCTQQQIAGLFRLLIDSVTGYRKDPQVLDEKKK
jgi:hypothetical protein